jgi:hypothetical protein
VDISRNAAASVKVSAKINVDEGARFRFRRRRNKLSLSGDSRGRMVDNAFYEFFCGGGMARADRASARS